MIAKIKYHLTLLPLTILLFLTGCGGSNLRVPDANSLPGENSGGIITGISEVGVSSGGGAGFLIPISVVGLGVSVALIFLTTSKVATYVGVGFATILVLSLLLSIYAGFLATVTLITVILAGLICSGYLFYITFVETKEKSKSKTNKKTTKKVAKTT